MTEELQTLSPESSAPTLAEHDTVAVASAIQRERAQLETSFTVAMRRPRNEKKAIEAIMRSADLPGFAEKAEYYYERGGEGITGPTVVVAREAKRCWGNLLSGFRVLDVTRDHVHLQGYCVDAETNAWSTMEATIKLVFGGQRSGWKYIGNDPRQVRDLILREGARLERNAILKGSVPPWLIQDVVDQCRKTCAVAAQEALRPEKREETIRNMVSAFGALGVTKEEIENRLGHEVRGLNEQERIELLRIYNALADEGRPKGEFFKAPESEVGTEESGKPKLDISQARPKEEPEDAHGKELQGEGEAPTEAPAENAETTEGGAAPDPGPVTAAQKGRFTKLCKRSGVAEMARAWLDSQFPQGGMNFNDLDEETAEALLEDLA